MGSRNIDDLIPPLQILFHQFRIGMDEKNIDFIVTSTVRTLAEQKALYAQGREPLDVVNNLRAQAGLPSITNLQNKKRVTWTMNSRHLALQPNDPLCTKYPEWAGKGCAFDIVILKNGKAVWDVKADIDQDNIPDYEEAASCGEYLGLIAGARFKPSPDYPHFEFDRSKA